MQAYSNPKRAEETRETIAGHEWRIRSGLIQNLGKFEGEPRYLPHFYEVYLNGFADETSGGVLSVEVTAEDKERFPELRRRKRVRFFVRDDGFVVEA